MVGLLVLCQFILVVLQLGCFAYSIKKGKDPFVVWYGFPIWASVPNLIICAIVNTL